MSDLERAKAGIYNADYVVARSNRGDIATRCVDARLLGRHPRVMRLPGDTLSILTALVVSGHAESTEAALPLIRQLDIVPGAHRDRCAYDHALAKLATTIANRDTGVEAAYGMFNDAVRRGLTQEKLRTVPDVPFSVIADKFEATLGKIKTHEPDHLINRIGAIAGSVVVDAPPVLAPPVAYIFDASTGGRVLGNVPDDVSVYLDTVPNVVATSNLNNEFMPSMLAISAATGSLIARGHNFPLLVMERFPEQTFRQVDMSSIG